MISQQEIAIHLGISQQGVSQMCAALAINWQTASLDDIRLKYIAHLREVAAGRKAEGGINLATERAALARAQRLRIEMDIAQRRGELAPVGAMEMVLARVGVKVGKILDTIPPQIRRRVPDIPAEVIEAIDSDIAKCRNMAAAMTLADLERDDDDEQEDEQEPPED